MKNRSQQSYIRWVYLVVGVIAMLFAGIIYGWSILKAPLAAEFGWSATELGLNFTITMAFFCIGGVLGGIMCGKTGPNIPLILSALFSCAGFILTSGLDGSSVVMLYLFYGVMTAVSIGVAYNVVISTVSAWFADKRGVCSGALMMGFGASALVLGNIAGMLIESPKAGWRTTFLALGIALGVVLFVTAMIIRRPQEQSKAVNQEAVEDSKKLSGEYTTFQMLGRLSFWKSFICISFLAAVGNSVISFAMDLSLSVGAAPLVATTLVGVLSICNGFGRILTGMLFDRIGRRSVMLIMNAAAIFAAAVTLCAIMTHSLPLCVAGLCITGISYGACPTINSVIISDFYGKKHFPVNFSVMNFNLTGASLVAGVANSLLASSGNFTVPFLLLLGLTIVALGLNLTIKRA